MNQIDAFNIKIHPATLIEFVSVIKDNLVQKNRLVQFGVNSATVNETRDNEDFRRVINSADLLNIDGMSVVWALRYLGYKVPERVATPDLAESVMAMAAENNFSVFLFGATESVISLCVENLRKTYPAMRIAGWRSGNYDVKEENSIINQINQSGAENNAINTKCKCIFNKLMICTD